MLNKAPKIALGTVQFGLPYGIANQQGQVSKAEAAQIVNYARHQGINTIDTAAAYGDSEKTLGEIGIDSFELVTKIPALPDDIKDVWGWVELQVLACLERLKVTALDGLLLHQPQQLLSGDRGKDLYKALCSVKENKLVGKIGVSIYQASELDKLMAMYEKFDLVQAPFNIVDRSLIRSGWLKKMHDAGTEIHVRSVFLQGLLLMSPAQRPQKFNRWNALWREWDEWLVLNNISALEACLYYPLSIPEINKVVVGTDSLAQWQQIIKAANINELPSPPASLQSEDIQLINPSYWNSL